MNNQISIPKVQSKFFLNVYGWMSFGLFLTAMMAMFISSNISMLKFVLSPFVFWPMVLAQFGLVAYLSAGLNSMSSSTAKTAFVVYAVITGVTLSSIFFVYTFASIASTFFICSGMFAAMAVYGHYTQSDLSSMGSYLFMALLGIIISSIANYFLQSSVFDLMISIFGVIVFTLLTAYDAQNLKMIIEDFDGTVEEASKLSIYGALSLYLDFINLFLYLLRFLGRKRD